MPEPSKRTSNLTNGSEANGTSANRLSRESARASSKRVDPKTAKPSLMRKSTQMLKPRRNVHPEEDEDRPSTFALTHMVDTAKMTMAEDDLKGKLPCIVNPETAWFGRWESVTAVALIFTAFVTPFEVGFLPPPETLDDPLFLVNRVVDAIFIVDMVVSSLSMYQVRSRKGDAVRSVDAWEYRPRRVCFNYLRGWFLLDVLSIFPSAFDIVPLVRKDSEASPTSSNSNLKIMRNVRTLRLIKLLRLVKTSNIIKKWETRFSMPYATIALSQLGLMVVYVVHLIACVLGIMSDFSLPTRKLDSWQGYYGWCGWGPGPPEDGPSIRVLVYEDGEGEMFSCVDSFEMWLQSLTWALAIVTGGGGEPDRGPYPDHSQEDGDTMKLLYGEAVTIIVLVLFGAAMWAYVTASFVDVIANSNPDAALFRNQMDDLNLFCAFHSLDPTLRRRLRAYLHERWQVQLAVQRRRVFNTLSEELQEEVAWQLNGQWLHKIPVLRDLPKKFLVRVALSLSSSVYAPKERPPAQRLYIIFQGCCTYKGNTLTVGETWGQTDMAKTNRPLRAIATTYLHVNFVATKTIFEIAEQEGRASTLWAIKKWVLFQEMRSYLLDNLQLERKRRAWEEARPGEPYPADLENMTPGALQKQDKARGGFVAPVSVERRVEGLHDAMADVKKELGGIKNTLSALAHALLKTPHAAVPLRLPVAEGIPAVPSAVSPPPVSPPAVPPPAAPPSPPPRPPPQEVVAVRAPPMPPSQPSGASAVQVPPRAISFSVQPAMLPPLPPGRLPAMLPPVAPPAGSRVQLAPSAAPPRSQRPSKAGPK